MPDLVRLRDYQREAKDAVWSSWDTLQRPAVVLPTGAGKTIIFTHMIAHHLTAWPGQRVIVLVHRDELADQAITKLHDLGIDAGKVKAADNELDRRVLVCSVQTVSRDNRLAQLTGSQADSGKIGLVIADECELAAAPSWLKVMRALGCFDDAYSDETSTRAVGFTATMARGDHVGLGKVWQRVVYSKSTAWMIANGYLVDVRGQSVDLGDLDLGILPRTGGDYRAGALGTAIVDAGGPEVISRSLRTYAPDRRTMLFLPDVASAEATLAKLRSDGWSADLITGTTPREDRRLIFKRTMTGETQVLVNCMVLTRGTDLPWMDCAMIARPTRSEPLFIQMVGRVMRLWEDKRDALVLLLNGAGGTIRTLVDLSPGDVRTVQPAETLAEAIIREAEEDNRIEHVSTNLAFCLRHRDVDLFKASSRQWLRTPGGVMFLPYGKGYVFLWPRKDSAHWDVCAALPHRPWKRLHSDLPLGTAQAWAETVTEGAYGASLLTTSDSRWRREPAAPRQIGKARSLGMKIEGTPQKGWLSDQISIRLAGNVFDQYVEKA